MKTRLLLIIFLVNGLLFLKSVNLKGQNLTQSNFKAVMAPRFMLNSAGTINPPVLPVVYRATINGLKKSATYRYYNQMARRTNFGAPTSGAGSMIFPEAIWRLVTATSLVNASGYSTFTTDTSGNYTGWFFTVPSNSPIYTAGFYLFPTIAINDGNNGTTVTARYALDDSIKVMQLATTAGANNATGIWGTSSATPENIIVLYSTINGTGVPLAMTYAENEGLNLTTPTFYTNNVNTINGAWGTIMPNDNPNGIRRIEQYSLKTGALVGCATDATGIWPTGAANTVNPLGGNTAVEINGIDAPLDGCSPVVNISSSVINAANVRQGTNNVVLYNPVVYANVLSTRLDTLKFTTAGSYSASDINNYSLKLWYSSNPVFDPTAVVLDSIMVATPGLQTFKPFLNIIVHNRIYLYITASISNTALPGDSIYITQTPLSGFILHLGSKTGSNPVPAGGAKTIISKTSPEIDATSLTSFGRVIINLTSAQKSFVISGTYLTPSSGNISISPPTGFQVSLTSGSGFSSSPITTSYSGGTLSSTNVYVIFKPTAIQTYGGNIKISSFSTSALVFTSGVGYRDTIPPKADTAYAVSLSTIKVVFDEAVNATGEVNANYTFNPAGPVTGTAKRCPTRDTVTITLTTPLTKYQNYTFTINNVQDTTNNTMTTARSFIISFGKLPAYMISQVRPIDVNGIPDSNNVRCKLIGIVQTQNFAGGGPVGGYRFYIHDGTGGICVYKTGAPPTYNAVRGDSIRVSGLIGNFNGLIIINPDSIKLLSSGHNQRIPTVVNKLDETTESEVVKIKALHLLNAALWPTIAGAARTVQAVHGADTINIRIEQNCALQGTRAPAYLFDITGVGGQSDNTSPYFQNYWITPRDTFDLIRYPYPGNLILNEVLCLSASAGGWTEFYNPTASPVYMYKYHLTNDTTNLNKYSFPDTANIPSLGYLLVYDSLYPLTPGLHADFSFNRTGGKVLLGDYANKIVDRVTYGYQKPDTSYARIPNATGAFMIAMPTPLAPNKKLPILIPSYQINKINAVNSNGVADSLSTVCRLTGWVISINYLAWAPGYEFTLSDNTAGICVYKVDSPFTNYPVAKIGDWLKVIGKITQYNGLLEIVPDSIDFIDSNHTITSPLLLTQTTAIAEMHESKLIRINNLTLKDTIANPWPKAGDLAMDVKGTNGTFDYIIHIETECGLHGDHGYKKPNKPFDIIGIGWQNSPYPYTSGYEIYPRLTSDLIIHTGIDNFKSSLKVYPNPSNGNFIIENSSNKIKITILNSIGQSVYENITSENFINVNLNVSQGIYLIKVDNVENLDSAVFKMKID